VAAEAHSNGAILLLLADDEDVVDASFLRPLYAAHELVVAEFQCSAHLLGAQFVHDAFGVVHLRFGHRQHTHLLGREPEREVAGVMLVRKPMKHSCVWTA